MDGEMAAEQQRLNLDLFALLLPSTLYFLSLHAALEIFFLCKNGGIENLIRFAYFAQSNRLKDWQKRNLNKVDNNTIVNRQWRTIVERIYLTDIYQNQDE